MNSLQWKLLGLSVLAGALLAALIFYKGVGTGEVKAELKQEKVNNATRARKAAVKPADSVSTVERLRSGSF